MFQFPAAVPRAHSTCIKPVTILYSADHSNKLRVN
ncbi:hypothetical protein KGM_211306 [Danaus plexippus plexippus]|uniref:Uncharacterized protein n=1 Tax=Danaus plexippus plexippus TaxID=278856 RepID=A0A212FIN1_DANPL|nr:hypothetical protein KGM_211306 [Danaus plexippus plexippus]